MSIAAHSFLAALIKQGDIKTYLKSGKVGHLFRSESDQALFKFFDEHVRTYAKLPDKQTVLTHGKADLPEPVEPSDYYLNLLKKAYVEVALYEAGKAAEHHLKAEDKDPIAALNAIRAKINAIDAHQMQPYVTDYREAGPALIAEYKKTVIAGDDQGMKFGWPTLDAMCGGIVDGDLVSFVGKPALGKTWLLLWSAMGSWKQKRPPLFVSMEIKPIPILQRLSAIHSEKAIGEIKTGTLSSMGFEAYTSKLKTLSGEEFPFWVVDGNLQATVQDIQALAMQLKPGAIFIDGAYLLKHPTERDRFRRVAENTDLIKQDLCQVAPVVASWQFNREARKLKKGEAPGLDHIGYSDTIGTHSSLVLGLFEHDSVETVMRRKIEVLKGRNGETGTFFVNWNFTKTTDFSETKDQELTELQY